MATPFSRQNFQQRAGSKMPGRVRRALDGGVESTQRYGNTLQVANDGRLEVATRRNGGLKVTKDGLSIDTSGLSSPFTGLSQVKVGKMTNPTDAPGSANSLRDNLVAQTLPAIQANLELLERRINEIIRQLQKLGQGL